MSTQNLLITQILFCVTHATRIPVSFYLCKPIKKHLWPMFMKELRFLFCQLNVLTEAKVVPSLVVKEKSIPFSLGTSLGSTCKHAIVTCPGGKTTYPVTCALGCPKDYSIKGSSTVTCQTSGQWSSYATSYCRRNNDPPTQVSAGDEHLISPSNVIAFSSR